MKTNKTVDQFGLEGDGIVENFFHLLWTKDPMFGTIPSVYVPHTVIFRYNEPVTWFFMKDGALKKKIKKNLTKEHIKEVFLRYKYPSGIVAVFMRYKFEGNSEEPNVVFEYYSEKEFLEFINNKWQMSNGILQQFIQPKGDKNCIIQANWSHKLCFFEKIEALTRINDPKYDIYDKALTFEAENYHSREGPLRGYVLPNKIQRICANVAQHVQNVSMENIQIARMVLHFKVDANNRIWFLMCASLRINQGSDENKTKMKLKLQGEDIIMNHKPEDYLSKIKTPENIKTNIIKGKPVNMHKTYECINCKSLLEPDSVFETSYKTIIQGYEHDHLKDKDRYKVNSVIKAKPGNMEELLEKLNSPHHDIDDNKLADDKVTSLVPPLIKRIYPRLKDETYKILREDLSFLKKTALFCENCVLQIQQSQESNLTAQKESDKDFYGTGKLKPEGVKFRYAHTLEAIKQKTEHTKTGSNFMKRNPAMRSGTTTPEVQSARHFRSQSELPHIFAGIRAQKTLKIIDNETENLSVESSEQTDDKDTPSNRVEAPIRTINGNLIPAPNFKMVKFKKENLKQLNLNTNRDPSRLLSIVTPRKTMLEELAKKENALAAVSGFTSPKTERVRTGSMQDIKGDVESQGLGEQTASTLAQTLTNYMPKMRFLQKEYQSVRSQSNNATLVRDSDTVERIFEMGNQKAKKELFEPFRRRK